MTTLEEQPVLDLCLDGADEVDPELNLIKGGGGALLREKIVASTARHRIIMVDVSKCVESLGAFSGSRSHSFWVGSYQATIRTIWNCSA